jgi:hypothetical protein
MSGCRRGTISVLVTIILAFANSKKGYAHGLDAQAFVLPGGIVQVEAWYSNGKPAAGAAVKVMKEEKDVVAAGEMNDNGIFQFNPKVAAPLRIVVNAGGGHQKEILLTAQELDAVQPKEPATSSGKDRMAAGGPTAPRPLADRSSRESIGNVVLGIALILGAAAFWMSLRNSRKLRKLESHS